MQKLLMPAAQVLAMDATDSACGDRLLKGMGKNVRAELWGAPACSLCCFHQYCSTPCVCCNGAD